MSFDELRQRFMDEGLQRDSLGPTPFEIFSDWYETAITSGIPEPTAMSIATIDEQGQPWQRMVLLKLFDETGFVFFTNYHSRKAQHIDQNNKVSLLFPCSLLAGR